MTKKKSSYRSCQNGQKWVRKHGGKFAILNKNKASVKYTLGKKEVERGIRLVMKPMAFEGEKLERFYQKKGKTWVVVSFFRSPKEDLENKKWIDQVSAKQIKEGKQEEELKAWEPEEEEMIILKH